MGTQYEYVAITEKPTIGLSFFRVACICAGFVVGDALYMGVDWAAVANTCGGAVMLWAIQRFVWKCPV